MEQGLAAILAGHEPYTRPPPKVRAAIAELVARDVGHALEVVTRDAGWLRLADAVGSPWHDADRAAMPWLDPLPKALAKRLRGALGVAAKRIGDRWHLAYLLEAGAEGWQLRPFVCGPPNPAPVVPALELSRVYASGSGNLTRHRWTVPPELASWYAVHDGLGGTVHGRFEVGALVPAAGLEIFAARDQMDDAFLAVFCDDAGHRRGFFKFGDKVYSGGYELDTQTRTVGKVGAKAEAVLTADLLATLT